MIDIDATVMAASPIVFLVIAMIRMAITIPSRAIPLVSLVLSGGYVGLSVSAGTIDGNILEYVLVTVMLAASAAGIQSTVSTLAPNGGNVEAFAKGGREDE